MRGLAGGTPYMQGDSHITQPCQLGVSSLPTWLRMSRPGLIYTLLDHHINI